VVCSQHVSRFGRPSTVDWILVFSAKFSTRYYMWRKFTSWRQFELYTL